MKTTNKTQAERQRERAKRDFFHAKQADAAFKKKIIEEGHASGVHADSPREGCSLCPRKNGDPR